MAFLLADEAGMDSSCWGRFGTDARGPVVPGLAGQRGRPAPVPGP